MLSPKEGPHGGLIEVMDGGVDYTTAVEKFKDDKGVRFVLAICGGADDDNPLLKHVSRRLNSADISQKLKASLADGLKTSLDDYVASMVRDILTPLRDYRIAVLTGGTKWGVPRIAAQIARELGFATIGVYPLTAKNKNALSQDQLDLSLCVHPFFEASQWGDESPILTKLLDAAIVIGGGAGTMVEVAHLLKLNEKKADLLAEERELDAQEETPEIIAKLMDVREKLPKHKLRHIVPISGTGGTADKLSFFPGKPKTMAACIPTHPITSGTFAARYLIDSVLPDTVYEPQPGADHAPSQA